MKLATSPPRWVAPSSTGMILCASGEIETTNFDAVELPDFETGADRQWRVKR